MICSASSVRPASFGSRMVTPEKSELAMPCRAFRYNVRGSVMVGSGFPADLL